MKNQTEIAKMFLYVFIILGAVLIFTAPFWHVDLPRESKEIKKIKSNHKNKEIVLTKEIKELRSAYNNKIYTAEEFIIISDLKLNELSELKKVNFLELNKAIEKQRFLSWKSPRVFVLGLGVRLPYIFFSLIISLLIMVRKNDSKYLGYAFSFLQVACWSISSYLMIWVFWDFQDYPLKVYRYGFIFISFLIGTACVYFITNYKMTIQVLKSKIRFIMNLMIKRSVDLGHINDENKYEEEIILPALKKLDE